MRALVDADILVYQVGFSCETTWYEAKDADGNVYVFPSKKSTKEFEGELYDIERKVEAEPDFIVKEQLKEAINYIKSATKADSFNYYLSGTENFRAALDSTYKANRKGVPKPTHYDLVTSLLIKDYGAEVVNGMEADDALGINQSKDTMIVSKDKDLLQVPGLHFLMHKNKKIKASKEGYIWLEKGAADKSRLYGHGFKWFAAQCLMGDPTDNIKGLKGLGDVKAYNILKDCTSLKDLWAKVEEAYARQERDDLLVNARLLWILREHGVHFDPKLIEDLHYG